MENSGIILVDKPRGITSRKVVDLFQNKLEIKKIGHAGTLDPLASGLLILLVNKATRLSGVFSSTDKIYEFTLCFGVQTDTDDLEGTVINRKRIQEPEKNYIVNTLSKFLGNIEQIPPKYSAVKYQGQRAYKLARKGIEISLKPRKVYIYNIIITNWNWPRVTLIARVSSGTYVRSLIRDIGEVTGYGATAHSICRQAIGNNFVNQAIDINQQKILYQNPENCLSHLAAVNINDINMDNNKIKLNQYFNNEFIKINDSIKYHIARRQNDNFYKIIFSGEKL
ncbi:MAG: tRNA pseudouridine(55) synthase TruB [bacterium]